MDARVRFNHQLLAVETEHRVHCMLELTAPPTPAGHTRLPLHLALVLDRSGSMSGLKLEVVRECAAFVVRRLPPTDELASSRTTTRSTSWRLSRGSTKPPSSPASTRWARGADEPVRWVG